MHKTHTNFDGKYITWECTTVCNYNCSYCWPNSHDGKYRWPNEDQLIKLIDYIKNFSDGKKVTLDIMGGEPTLWPKFKEFCNIVSDYAEIHFSSNGSRKARWWKDFNASISLLMFSYHPEYANTAHFIDVLSTVDTRYSTLVYILYHPDYKEKCLDAFKQFKESNLQIDCMMKKIDCLNYTKEEIDDLFRLSFLKSKIPLAEFNPTYYIDDVEINPDIIIKNKKNSFLNWNCNLGQNYRYIRASGEVHGASCSVSESLGNIYFNDSIKDPSPMICTSNFCGCKTDVVLNNKHKV
jgi:MoaA/NifB/PqqE/SkfB family radical SAM enzyme